MDDKQFSLPGTSLPMYFDRFSHWLLGTLLCKPFPETWAFCIHSSSNMALFKSAPLLDLRVLGAGLLGWYLCSAPGTAPHTCLELGVCWKKWMGLLKTWKRFQPRSVVRNAFYIATWWSVCAHAQWETNVHVCLTFASYFTTHNALRWFLSLLSSSI